MIMNLMAMLLGRGGAVCLLGFLLASCAGAGSPMDEIAQSYVRLVLAMGAHDPDYVDAYYGPAEWRTEVEATTQPLDSIRARAEQLVEALNGLAESEEEIARLRWQYLRRQLESLIARTEMLSGNRLTFDQESAALYDAVAPHQTEEHFRQVLDRLARVVPGTGAVQPRYEPFRDQFVIPATKLDTVFQVAIAECRRRTLRYLALPEGESFSVEYVTDKAWSGYNWYQGEYRSLIQVNTDLPIYIDRAIDLACHEGYPGHHTYNVLLEHHLVRARGWVEYSVYPLFSPQSLIAEGSANFGIDMAFPEGDRVAFERDVLFPLAGLDPARAEEYYRVQDLVDLLGYAGNEAARRYLDGEISADSAATWLTTYALMTPARARQRVRFIDQYRSYVINYNLGRDLVARHVAAVAGAPEQDQRIAWEEFGTLLSSPTLPSGLKGLRSSLP